MKKTLLWMCCIVGMLIMFGVPTYAETYKYDSLDRVIKVTYEDGSYILYEYDAAGNMTKTTVYEPETENEEDGRGETGNDETDNNETGNQDIFQFIEDALSGMVDKFIKNVWDFMENLFGGIFG